MSAIAVRPKPPVGPPPSEADLRKAALAYLARYAATEASLRRVLERRIERWLRATATASDAADEPQAQAAEAKRAARAVITRLAAEGLVNDATFAESKARGLFRAGRSRRAVAAHLSASGVDAATVHDVLHEHSGSELAAALVLARRRRIGPFRIGAPDRQAELAIMARAGFTHQITKQALEMERTEAEVLVAKLRR
ncbi:MAG: RecX family transcriptional regulator [Acetobacteraceae bacterium]|nr:RecX family transcriptional regulator [Acetobacteraceae bacterium]